MRLVSGSVHASGHRAGGRGEADKCRCGARASLPVRSLRGQRGRWETSDPRKPLVAGPALRAERTGPFGRLQAANPRAFPYTRPAGARAGMAPPCVRVTQRPGSGPRPRGTREAGRGGAPEDAVLFGSRSRDAGALTACQLPGKQDALTGWPTPATPGCFQVQRAT